MFQELSNLEVGKVIVGIISFVVVCYGFRLLFLIVNTNRKIESLIRERDKKIEEETSHVGMTISVADAIKIKRTQEYEKKIAPLIRKKGYVLDILPLIPKK